MSNPNIFTKETFSVYCLGLLSSHGIELTDEENNSSFYKVGGDVDALVNEVMDLEVCHLTIDCEGDVLGGISLVTEMDFERNVQTVEVYNYSAAVEHLVPQYED